MKSFNVRTGLIHPMIKRIQDETGRRSSPVTALLTLLLVGWVLWLPQSAHAQIDESDLLDPDVAFAIQGEAEAADRVRITWTVADGYYMYRHALGFSSETEGVSLGEAEIPVGEQKVDEFFGEVETYRQTLSVVLPLEFAGDAPTAVTIQARSQGCADLGVCYPPHRQSVTIELPAAGTAPAAGSSATAAGNPLRDLLAGGNGSSVIAPPQQDEALSPEAAFTYEAIELNAGTVLVRFTPETGYYLYRDQFEFRVTDPAGFTVRQVELPPGEIKDDPEFGNVQVYFEQVEIPVRLSRPQGPATEISLTANFQGCRDGDICYPPMERTVQLTLPEAAAAIGDNRAATASAAEAGQSSAADAGTTDRSAPVTEQDRLARLLVENPVLAFFGFFVAGLLLAFTPCVFPMVPILTGIIAGQGDNITTGKAFRLSLVYVLAMAVTYTVAGVLAGLFGQNLQALFQNPWIISAFAVLFVLLALAMFGFYELQLPNRFQSKLNEMSNRQSGGNYLGVAVMGLLSALIVGPCVAPALAAALIVIGGSGDALLGGTALFFLAMGMGVPLLIFGASAGKLLPKAGPWMDAVKAAFGIGLLALAIWMLGRILPGGVIMLLWGVLAIASGVYLGALTRLPDGVSGWRRLWQSLGVVLLVLGIAELLGAAAGGDDWTEPLAPFTGGGSALVAADSHGFELIKTEADLEQALAANAGRTVMLDFYADWCVECKRMEKNTFPDPAVQTALKDTLWLQADVTAFDAADQALVKRFGLIGPPAILFFDEQGEEIRRWRMIGYMGPEEFASHVNNTFAQR